MTIRKFTLLMTLILLIGAEVNMCGQKIEEIEIKKFFISKAIAKSYQLKSRDEQIKKAELDKRKAYQQYLPKVNFETSYTILNKSIEFSDEFKNLLNATQSLLIKEQVAIQMQPMAVPDNYKVGFATAYTNQSLSDAVNKNFKPIGSIQDQQYAKANINAQMMVFSGMKVPFAIKAASNQEQALEKLRTADENALIAEVLLTFDKLSIVNAMYQALKQTNDYLIEQYKLVSKAQQNGVGLTINIHKVELAQEQLKTRNIELDNSKRLLIDKLHVMTDISVDSIESLKLSLDQWILSTTDVNVDSIPEIDAMGNAIKATNFKYKSELADYTPKVFVTGKKELITNTLTMFEPEWYVGVGLRWTLFDGMVSHTNARQTKCDMNVLINQRNQYAELARINNTRIILEIEKNNQRIIANNKQMKLAEEIYRQSKEQFQNGLIAFSEYLNSINELESARVAYCQSVSAQRASVIEFLRTQGKLSIDVVQ